MKSCWSCKYCINDYFATGTMDCKKYDDMTEEDKIKSCSTKLFQKFNDINVPVVIMVTKNKKRLEKKYLDYDFDEDEVKKWVKYGVVLTKMRE